ncbi:hypothetical protein OIU34_21530 [Pararhizobium sp. BT-229]|uniref:hypothetical protein n=1 Tax=Pararhizobium sp. BT-229 TaxID=2986923 RepID=UPI0021F7FA9C|nr:hypothetical protein [Pararhizobium sp. BT-229]MCV9964475.1 hypothetical protein [Pararhizobium sp. BT-229]
MPDLDYPKSENLNFGGGKPTPARPENLDLANALFRLIETQSALEAKMASVPSYTGQWSPEDYYADEQEDFNRAVDAYADTVKALTASNEAG